MEEYFGDDLEAIMIALENNDDEIMQFIHDEVDEVNFTSNTYLNNIQTSKHWYKAY